MPPGDGRYIGLANVCVVAFFVISGYVLTRGWRGAYAGFLVRRFLRLWPLYALCLAVGGWLSANPAPLSNYRLVSVHGHRPAGAAGPRDVVAVRRGLGDAVHAAHHLASRRRPRVMVAGRWRALVFVHGSGSHDLYYGAFFIVGSHLADRTASSRFLESAPAQWLGRISYSLYLSHVLTIGVLKFHSPGLWLYLAIPACLAVAHVLCVTVEQPSIALSRRAGRCGSSGRSAARRLAPA